MQRHEWTVRTNGRGFTDLTARVNAFVAGSGVRAGLCNVFLVHTSASLILGENADPSVRRDLETYFARLVPDGDPRYEHDAEGPDDMPSPHPRGVDSELCDPAGDRRRVRFGNLAGAVSVGAPENSSRASRHRQSLVSAAQLEFTIVLFAFPQASA